MLSKCGRDPACSMSPTAPPSVSSARSANCCQLFGTDSRRCSTTWSTRACHSPLLSALHWRPSNGSGHDLVRPACSASTSSDVPLAIGVDVGGTKVATGVVDDGGAILAQHVLPTP